jgi:hypothetical protein
MSSKRVLQLTIDVEVDRGEFEPLAEWRYHPKTLLLIDLMLILIYPKIEYSSL